MGRYKVFGRAKSLVVLPNKISNFTVNINNPIYDITAHIENCESISVSNKSLTNILSITAIVNFEVKDNELNEVISLFKFEADKILEKMSFVSGMPISDLRVIKCYNITENIDYREYIQFGYDKIDKVASNKIKVNNLVSMVNSVKKLDVNVNGRIGRAIHWYTKAINEEDIMDRFSYVWIAFEALNPWFQKRYNIIEETKCPNCGHIKQIDGLGSLKYYFEKEIGNAKLYSKARRIRNELQHSFEDINKVIKKIYEIEDDLLACLRKAIVFVLGISNSEIEYPNYINSENVTVVAYVKINDFLKSQGDEFVPDIDISVDVKEDGENVIIEPIFKINFADIGFSAIGWEFYGNPGSHITKQQVTVIG